MSALKLFLVAAEPSGDALGGGLAGALRERLGPDGVTFSGVGGPRMAAYGVESPFDISELSVLGLVEGLKAYPRVVRRADETAALAEAVQPDAAVLIDSWGFTLRVAQRLRARLPYLPLIKYVGPQVWASRPGRAKTLAATVDHVLALQPFEPPYFEAAGLAATFVGHPTLDAVPRGDAAAFRARYGLGADQKLVIFLFGSRRSEAERMAPAFADAAARLRALHGPRLAMAAPLAGSVATQIRAMAADDARLHELILVDEPEREDAFAAADAALACSGTVVTELAMTRTPTVVAYKLGGLTHLIARFIVTAPHISLVNMAAGERVLPEFVQGAATGEALARAVSAFLDDSALAERTRERLGAAIDVMRAAGGSASARAADAVLAVLNERTRAPA